MDVPTLDPADAALQSIPHSILVVEDDPAIGNMLRTTLEFEGYEAAVARNGADGIEAALRELPELILLDLMLPDIDGMQVLQRLREEPKSEHIPVIVVSARHDISSKVKALDLHADDYLTKPWNTEELMARIRIRLQPRDVPRNHLTGLPAGKSITSVIERQLNADKLWALLYFDLDNFKAYNDAYGPFAGDEMIKLMGRIAQEVVRERGNLSDFLGHIGGDDFVLITTPARIVPLSNALITAWDTHSQTRAYYSEDDLTRGLMYGKDRNSVAQLFPLSTVSIGVVTNQHRTLSTLDELSKIAAEVKAKAKSTQGSCYYIDRRTGLREDDTGADVRDDEPPIIVAL